MRILVIDDDRPMLRCIQRILRSTHEVLVAESVSDAFLCLANERVDVILCDVHLRGCHAATFVSKLSALDAGRLVLMTGGACVAGDKELLAGRRVLYKPFRHDDLLATLAEASAAA